MKPTPTPDLLPCPFCGGEAEHRKNAFLGDNSMAHCRMCGASAYDRKWNQRTSPSDSEAVADIIAANVQSVCDWDDRTSPDDYPDHLLITPAELSELLEGVISAALSVQPAAAVVGEPVDKWRLFPKKTPEEVDRDPAYREVSRQLKPLRDAFAPASPPAPDVMQDALSLVIEYDDLLRHWEGPEQVLLAGDVEEIDAAYDKMVAACRAALGEGSR